MMRFARIVGVLSMISGAFLLVSPDSTRELLGVPVRGLRELAEWNADFAQLSSGAMRMLGGSNHRLALLTTKSASAKMDKLAPLSQAYAPWSFHGRMVERWRGH